MFLSVFDLFKISSKGSNLLWSYLLINTGVLKGTSTKPKLTTDDLFTYLLTYIIKLFALSYASNAKSNYSSVGMI